MNLLQAIILGIVQGITEFLPISSTAHLTLAGKLMGLITPETSENWTASIAVIQLGTLVAVLAYFRNDLMSMLTHVLGDLKGGGGRKQRWSAESLLAWKIVLGTLPVVVIGLAFKKIIEGYLTKETWVIASAMIALALVLLWAERSSKHQRTIDSVGWKDALWIGIGQCFALIPGSSRSGTTMTSALFLGFTRDAAARFSFLLSIPAVAASGLLELYKVRHDIHSDAAVNLVIATVVSGIVGYASIAFLIKYLKTHTTYAFIGYRLVLGSVLWILLISKVIS